MQLGRVQSFCAGRVRLAAPVSKCSHGFKGRDAKCTPSKRRIHFNAAVADPTVSEEAELRDQDAVAASFTELGIDERLTVMLPELGVKLPSEIQEQAIPAILDGRTLAIQSFTGSGKTLAFLLPVMTLAIRRLEARLAKRKSGGGEDGGLEAIIVAPSRELAMQTVRVAQKLLPPEAWPLVQQCIGGANSRYQLEALKKNKPLVVIGTPGRLAEHSRSGALRSHTCGSLVMDEVDQLLCPQFREDMLRLVQHTGTKLPNGPQVVMASATVSKTLMSNIQSLLGTKQDIPIITPHGEFSSRSDSSERASSGSTATTTTGVTTDGPSWGWGQDSGFWAGKAGAAVNRSSAGGLRAESTANNSMPPQLDHVYITEVKRHHLDAVRRTVYALNAQRVIVFMNFQDRLRDAMYKLGAKGLSVAVLHGELGKQQRQAVLDGFRSGKFRVLVVSDVVCRGLDVMDCDAVINLELPSNPAHYAHRAGRTGRMGRPGTVVSIIEKQQQFVVDKLGRSLEVDMQPGKLTGGQVTVIRDGKVHVLGASRAVPGAAVSSTS